MSQSCDEAVNEATEGGDLRRRQRAGVEEPAEVVGAALAQRFELLRRDLGLIADRAGAPGAGYRPRQVAAADAEGGVGVAADPLNVAADERRLPREGGERELVAVGEPVQTERQRLAV